MSAHPKDSASGPLAALRTEPKGHPKDSASGPLAALRTEPKGHPKDSASGPLAALRTEPKGPATTLADAIPAALATVDDPEIRRPITDLGMVRSVEVDAAGVAEIGILLTVVGCPLKDKLTADISAAVGAV